MYFQFLGLPSASHWTACSSRRVRVVWVLASLIHSTYSRRWLGLNFSKVVAASLLACKALARSSGTTSSLGVFSFGFDLVGDLTPSSLSFMACLMREDRPGEFRGPCDIGVDAIIALSHESL